MIMAYPEGSGHDIIKVVYSNAKSEYFLGETEENHGESGYPVFVRRRSPGGPLSATKTIKCSVAETLLLSRSEVGKMWVVCD